MERSDKYLMIKRGLYYRPNACGYTGIKAEAGRYPLAIAEQDADRLSGLSFAHEDDCPDYSPACFEDLKLKHITDQRNELLEAGRAYLNAHDTAWCVAEDDLEEASRQIVAAEQALRAAILKATGAL